MADIHHIIERVEAHIAKTGSARSTVSRKVFGNGNRLDELKAGGNVTIKTLDRAEAAIASLETR